MAAFWQAKARTGWISTRRGVAGSAPGPRIAVDPECVENGPDFAFAPDGRLIIVHDAEESSLWLIDSISGKLVRRLAADWFRFSPDGKLLLTAAGENRKREERET